MWIQEGEGETPILILEPWDHSQNLEPCISELGTWFPCRKARAVIILSILHVLLFLWSVQVAFLQHG